MSDVVILKNNLHTGIVVIYFVRFFLYFDLSLSYFMKYLNIVLMVKKESPKCIEMESRLSTECGSVSK